MVYRGKPSSACAWCRARRLKCDRKRPSCSSCVRARRTCTGYRDIVALSFQDQTDEVIGKARRRVDKQTVEPSPSPSSFISDLSTVADDDTNDDDQVQPGPGPLMLQHIPAPTRDDGISFVLANHVATGPSAHAHLSFLPSLLQAVSNPAITASVNAMGLATLANIQRNPRLMLAARREYSTALSETNAALCDQARATSDSTLAAVLLLGLFEIVTCDTPALMARWANHIDGAMKMVELRGAEQLRTPTGLGLFMQLRSQFVLSNIYRKKSTPTWLLELSQDAVEQQDLQNGSMEQLFAYLTKTSDLCARISVGTHDGPTAIIYEAMKMDADLVAWALSVDPSWQYSRINITPDSETDPLFSPIYGDYYHIYSNINSAVLWNTYRLTRIVVHEIIGAVCQRVCEISGGENAEHRAAIRRSEELSLQMAEDICASVPFVFRYSASVCPGLPQASGGIFRLHWALFVAADCLGSTPPLQAWILDCLDQIGYNSGVQQALSMSKILRSGMHLEWLTGDFKRLGAPAGQRDINQSLD
ncbi:Zn(II)2Cys6 transcription factor [Aspergillus heteromorphus CBS 117.55]|uniref:Zn(II)2Cys6 transcription factor n=1 Tax=Aspergillus heteromorphus CBS 117.55 TaxID=1448321 RepID=A0A317WYG1_9EURO|nr:Zn(II)2Cys6 transcription factor [Aspergillus heteromorphus CBS 117.55]PWY89240.1 Zn(II)2Cys6 transcription factor [Aspergillus heteromorphus CBS 117.55]